MAKLIKLTFKETGGEHFFRSYASIYRSFTPDEVSVSLGHIWNTARKNNGYFENKTVIIEPINVQK